MVKETSLIFVSRKVIYVRTPKWTLERASFYLICIHSNFFVLRLVTKLLKNARQLHTIHVPRENQFIYCPLWAFQYTEKITRFWSAENEYILTSAKL